MGRTALYTIVSFFFLLLALGNGINGHILYSVSTGGAALWFGVLALVSSGRLFPEIDSRPNLRRRMSDFTILYLGILSLGIVGFESQIQSAFLPLFVALLAAYILRRRRSQERVWEVV